jgi:acyl-CoA thioester hydrolase
MSQFEIFQTEISVRFRDIDALGHVNNAVIITYLEHGRARFFIEKCGVEAANKFDFILAHISCDYLHPILISDIPLLNMWVTQIGSKSFHFGYQLVSKSKPEQIFAKAQSVQVCYDYDTKQTVSVPTAMRELLAPYLREHTS